MFGLAFCTEDKLQRDFWFVCRPWLRRPKLLCTHRIVYHFYIVDVGKKNIKLLQFTMLRLLVHAAAGSFYNPLEAKVCRWVWLLVGGWVGVCACLWAGSWVGLAVSHNQRSVVPPPGVLHVLHGGLRVPGRALCGGVRGPVTDSTGHRSATRSWLPGAQSPGQRRVWLSVQETHSHWKPRTEWLWFNMTAGQWVSNEKRFE